jgi:hypothetical protein
MVHEPEQRGCWRLAFWIGWAWNSALRPITQDSGASQASKINLGQLPITSDELRRPLLSLPAGRDYRVLVAPMATDALFDTPGGPWGEMSPPNLMWSSHRQWCVGTEIDFDSTIVGGSESLVGDLLARPGMETWSIGPDDCLTSDADKINQG